MLEKVSDRFVHIYPIRSYYSFLHLSPIAFRIEYFVLTPNHAHALTRAIAQTLEIE